MKSRYLILGALAIVAFVLLALSWGFLSRSPIAVKEALESKKPEEFAAGMGEVRTAAQKHLQAGQELARKIESVRAPADPVTFNPFIVVEKPKPPAEATASGTGPDKGRTPSGTAASGAAASGAAASGSAATSKVGSSGNASTGPATGANGTQQPVEPAKKAYEWPNLSLTGIVMGKSVPLAVINGEVYRVGQTVEGVKITEIKLDRVILQNDEGEKGALILPGWELPKEEGK